MSEKLYCSHTTRRMTETIHKPDRLFHLNFHIIFLFRAVEPIHFTIFKKKQFSVMSHKSDSIGKWLFYIQAGITVLSLLTSALMAFGLWKENPQMLGSKLKFIEFIICFLLIWAVISIVCMAFGIQFTRQVFGIFGKVHRIEQDYGPIWPFNIAVVSFFTAAIAIWTRIIIQGAADYLYDKAYFADKQNVELRESSKTR
nr:hypothetical protein ZC328.1 - Caenorhabditis elegans [Caenorhabditis elegans]